ncbi:NADH-quinone oxidoreductase subunit A [Candidatus Acetothermia bacterium]|nr:NADH-quinone oxidoreductase subunit A [Candidatus Acetothermia bacterium]MBI3459476.1 NADH-quinone oxidoreductase subunit A [Candidatus Acetothermia bacterium]MBI3658912.1 NADH-quinone oxidoreductase subunit A [Candidatus Acetothermia bacterium]
MGMNFFPVFVYFILVVGFAGLMTGLTLLLGSLNKHPTPDKLMPYESGMIPIGSARVRIPIHFHLIAMLFLVFDIEVAFIYPWALIFKSLGLMGVIEMFVFIGILLVGFLYALKRGAFVWE